MKYGRRAPYPAEVRPRLRLRPALDLAALPPIPPLVDEVSRVPDWPMYLNDEISDCTVAAAGHMIQAWTTYGQGSTVRVSDRDVLTAYSAISGYDPATGANDDGAVMQDVLDYWRKTGIGGRRILAFAELDVADLEEVRAALYLFGHIYLGIDVPRSAEQQFAAGQPWDVPAGSDGGIVGGHAVDLGLWDRPTSRLEVITWATRQPMTLAFWRRYVAEAWVAADQSWITATGGSPPGLDTVELNRQYTALTSQPGPFPTTPAPDPADAALALALRPWAYQRHCGANRRAALAGQRWLAAKGL